MLVDSNRKKLFNHLQSKISFHSIAYYRKKMTCMSRVSWNLLLNLSIKFTYKGHWLEKLIAYLHRQGGNLTFTVPFLITGGKI